MSGTPAARLGDPTACPHTGHGSNPLVQGSPDVLFDSRPAARQGDTSACGGALSAGLIPNVLINGRPAAVVGSQGAHGNLVTAGSGSVFIGTVTVAGSPLSLNEPSNPPVNLAPPTDSLARAWREEPSDPAPLDLEEEEEEEETERLARQGITLRIGVFFDGTGNNLANAALTEQCRREDLELFDAEQLRDIINHCQAYGYGDLRGGHFERLPSDSYANAESNVARLYELYRDESFRTLSNAEKAASVKVYLEGIGTRSSGSDSLYAQGTGRGDTGVLARVAQSPAKIAEQLRKLLQVNPALQIDTLEFDVFGFSRGAASARHFVNELLKPKGGLLAGILCAGNFGLVAAFDWTDDVRINFVGLFDTVAAVVNVGRADISPANGDNSGVNLYLPSGCARKVLQLAAADEQRHNFALNSVAPEHQQIVLPGAHADLGGGYRAHEPERYLLSRPQRSTVASGFDPQNTAAYRQALAQMPVFEARGLAAGGRLSVACWSRQLSREERGGGMPQQHVYAAVAIDRSVRGELSLVYLRVMRELALAYGVPLTAIPDIPRYKLPAELTPIADKLLAQAKGEATSLTEMETRLLWGRYIHLSANWTPSSGFLINRPAEGGRRVFAHQPQEGYPE